MSKPLTFKELRVKGQRRCRKYFPQCAKWTPSDWGIGLAEEVGEVCGVMKKMNRGQKKDRHGNVVNAEEVGKEIADVVIYCDLLASHYGFDLGELVRGKFNEISDRVNSKIKL